MQYHEYLTKSELAERLKIKARGVECLMASGKIPYIRVSPKILRFDWPQVCEVLNGYQRGGTDDDVAA